MTSVVFLLSWLFLNPILVNAQVARDNVMISNLGDVGPDTEISGVCYCTGSVNICDTDGNCKKSSVDSCGGVEKEENCSAKYFNSKKGVDAKWCEGSKNWFCTLNNSISATLSGSGDKNSYYTYFDSCAYKGFEPKAPLKNAGIDARCSALRYDVENTPTTPEFAGTKIEIKKPLINILIPDLTFSDVRSTTDEQGNIVIPWIGEYIAAIYKLGVSVAGILAVVLLIREGALIILSGGGEEKVQGYKNIGRIIAGLVLAMGSYVILYNINTSLVSFRPLQIKYAQLVDVSEADEAVSSKPYVYTTGANNVPYFPQWEGPWAASKPGDLNWPMENLNGRKCDTIQQRGCGVTSLAMVLKYYGVDVTPLDVGRWGLGCTGAWQPSLTMEKTSRPFSAEWPSMKGEIIWKSKSDFVLRKKIMTLLTNKKPLVVNCARCYGLNKNGEPFVTSKTGELGYRGHYVVLTGVLTSGYTDATPASEVVLTVNDPGANENKRIRTMTLSDVLSTYKVGVYIDKVEDFKSVNK